MTNERMLECLNGINMEDLSWNDRELLHSVIEGLKDNLRSKASKSRGNGSAIKLYKNIAKVAKRNGNLDLTKVQVLNGKRYLCDGYRLFCMNDIDGMALPEMESRSAALERLIDVIHDKSVRVDIDKLKAEYKIAKSTCKEYKKIVFRPAADAPALDMELLLPSLEGIGTDTIEYSGMVAPIYLKGKAGFGLVLGVNVQEDFVGIKALY